MDEWVEKNVKARDQEQHSGVISADHSRAHGVHGVQIRRRSSMEREVTMKTQSLIQNC